MSDLAATGCGCGCNEGNNLLFFNLDYPVTLLLWQQWIWRMWQWMRQRQLYLDYFTVALLRRLW